MVTGGEAPASVRQWGSCQSGVREPEGREGTPLLPLEPAAGDGMLSARPCFLREVPRSTGNPSPVGQGPAHEKQSWVGSAQCHSSALSSLLPPRQGGAVEPGGGTG
ncbi:hypothetical protein KIL84_007570 [Mauremys mutica]|uniref:Uncharacterized protein n=1 Tax=Mauremys mutica TaxID=74926 RepID=A0A9D3X1J7_9SAUR|nr:hypothetical protein KIL84_007570 [Mauremys mutica]